MYCGLCNHKAGSVGDLKEHMVEDHKKCNVCKKYVTNEEDLRIPTENKHAEFKCPMCKKLRTSHLTSHKENKGFGKTLENVGKITKNIARKKEEKKVKGSLYQLLRQKKHKTNKLRYFAEN